MSGITIALIANALLAVSLIIDKGLLAKQPKGKTLAYVFWIGILNAVGVIIIFFDFAIPSWQATGYATLSGLFFFLGLLFFYCALDRGEASYSPALIGGFAPIFTLIAGSALLSETLNVTEYISFAILVLAGFCMFFAERFRIRAVLPWVLLSSLAFGLAAVLEKLAFNETSFGAAYSIAKAATLLAALALLLFPRTRRAVHGGTQNAPSAHRILFFGNRALAGIGSLLIFYAVSIEHPALIEALAGVRYALIFVLAFLITRFFPSWLNERFGSYVFWIKALATILVVVGLSGLILQNYYENRPLPPRESLQWGATFSPLMAEQLSFDSDVTAYADSRSPDQKRRGWQEMYLAILDDLKPDGIRIVAYWSRVEKEKGVFDFSELDWQMDEAARRNVPVILAVGQKVPRWPECHFPNWVREEFLISPPEEDRPMADNFQFRNENIQKEYEKELLEYISVIVNRYKNHPALQMWQVENEPFLRFGECPAPDADLVSREVELVRALDPQRQILMTDGGEFGDWYRAAKQTDIFGSTLYRRVYHDVFGHITYPLTPEFYKLRRDVLQWQLKQNVPVIAIEVGLEPWDKKQIQELPYEYQKQLLSVEDFEEDIDYAIRAGFDTYYLWGAEWWYWAKTQQNDDRYWNAIQSLITNRS